MEITIGDIVSATGTIVAPRNDGRPAHPLSAPEGTFAVVGFFGRFAQLRDVLDDPDAKDIDYQGWPVDQLVKH